MPGGASRTIAISRNATTSEPTGTATDQPPRLREALLDADRRSAAPRPPPPSSARSPRRLACAASTSPTIRPSYMTAIRSDRVISSSRSSVMSRIGHARCCGLSKIGVHGLDRADVEAARRCGDDEHARAAPENSRASTTFCRLPPESWRAERGRAGRLHVVPANQLDGPVADVPEAQERADRVLVVAVRLEHDVRRDAEARGDARVEAVLRDVRDAGPDRRPRVACANGLAADADRPAGEGAQTR